MYFFLASLKNRGEKFTVGIWNPTLSGFWMVQKRLACKWSGFRIGSEIRKPNHLKTDQNGRHLVFTIWHTDFLVRILNGPVFKWLKTNHLKSDLQKVRISNGRISDPHCTLIPSSVVKGTPSPQLCCMTSFMLTLLSFYPKCWVYPQISDKQSTVRIWNPNSWNPDFLKVGFQMVGN